MAEPRPFAPQFGANQIVVLVAATPQAKNITADSQVLRVLNVGAGDCYVKGYSSATVPAPVASTTDYRVSAGQDKLITVGDVIDRVSLFSVAGTTVEIIPGDGGI